MLQNPLAQVLGIVPPRPKFELFQSVRSHYVYEDISQLDDIGIIIGYFYSPGLNAYGYEAGWLYVVCWHSMPSSPHLHLPYIEESHQDELRPLDLT